MAFRYTSKGGGNQQDMVPLQLLHVVSAPAVLIGVELFSTLSWKNVKANASISARLCPFKRPEPFASPIHG